MSTSGEVLLPPLLPVTVDDHGAWVIVVSTILLIITALATTVTFISRIRILRKLSWSDSAVFLSLFFFIPQTACINIASFHGIGKHRHALSDPSFEVYSKTVFASQLLAVVVLSCSKTAVVLLVLSLQPFEKITFACKSILGMIAAWTLASLVALGTQCNHPRPWISSPDRCVNQYALYISLGAIHMILDLSIIALPMTLLHQVQIIQWKRHQISALFATRILVMALTIAGLRSLHPIFKSKHPDRPWHMVMPAIWLQLILSSSILCTCIPTLKRVLADLQTGMMAGAVSEFFEQSVSGHTNTGSHSGSKSDSGIGRGSASSTPHSRPRRDSTGVERVDSQAILRDHAIVQTIDYEVRYDGKPTRVSSHYESDSSIHMDSDTR